MNWKATQILVGFLLVFLALTVFTQAQPVRDDNGNIGLYGVELQQVVVEQESFENLYDVNVLPSGRGTHLIDLKIDNQVYLDLTTMAQKDFCKTYFGIEDKKLSTGGLTPVDKNYVECQTFIEEVKTGMVIDDKGRGTIGVVSGKDSRIETTLVSGKNNSIKIGRGSIDIYYEDGNVDLVVTPESATPIGYVNGLGWKYHHTMKLTNDGNGLLHVSAENFGADGISYSLFQKKYFYTTEALDTNCFILTDKEFGDHQVCDYYRLPDGNINWDYNYPQAHPYLETVKSTLYTDVDGNILVNEDNWVEISSGEETEFIFQYFSKEKQGKWDFHFFYDGIDYFIDPYWATGVSSGDLNHDFDYNGFVFQRNQTGGTIDLAWTPTGELDWNTDGNFEVGGSDWDSNLIMYYKFNDTNGSGGIYDSARGNDGLLTNGANINARGMWDTNALNLDGTNDYAETDSSSIGNGASEISFSAWFKVDVFGSFDGIVFSRGSQLNGIDLGNLGTTELCGWTRSVATCTSKPVTLGVWHQAVVTYDGTTSKIYYDGELINTGSTSGSVIVDASFLVGRDPTSSRYFDGEIDEVKIWDRALTEQEVVADYNSFLSAHFVDANVLDAGSISNWNSFLINKDVNYSFGKEICGSIDDCNVDQYNDGLSGLWHLNNDANDSSGNNNNGTWGGTEAYTTGLWGTNTGTFDGSTDYISIPNDATLSPEAGNFTISSWFKTTKDYSAETGAILRNYGSVTTNLYLLEVLTDNKIWGYFRDGLGNAVSVSGLGPTVNDGKWHQGVTIRNGTTVYLYLDGVLLGSATNGSLGTISTNSGDPVNIGRYFVLGGDHSYFGGEIEEVAVWKKALTEQEVVDLYRKGATKLDLNVYSCSDSTCSTKTSSQYITDANNNSWMDISGLSSSQYFGWESYFKPINELIDYNAGTFHVNSFLQDANVEYSLSPIIQEFYYPRVIQQQTAGDFSTSSTTFQTIFQFDFNYIYPETEMHAECAVYGDRIGNKLIDANYRLQYSLNGVDWNTAGSKINTLTGENVFRSTYLVSDSIIMPNNADQNVEFRLQHARVGGNPSTSVVTTDPVCNVTMTKDVNGLELKHQDYSESYNTTSTNYENVGDLNFNSASYDYRVWNVLALQFGQTGADGTPYFKAANDNNSVEWLRSVGAGEFGSGGAFEITEEITTSTDLNRTAFMKTTAGTGTIDLTGYGIGVALDGNEFGEIDFNGANISSSDLTIGGSTEFTNNNGTGSFRASIGVPYTCSTSECEIQMLINVTGTGYDQNSTTMFNTGASTIGDTRMINHIYLFEDVPSGDLNMNIYASVDTGTATAVGGSANIIKVNTAKIVETPVYNITFNALDSMGNFDLNNVNIDCNNGLNFDFNSPITQTFIQGSYSCNFTKSGYDANTGFEFVSDSDKSLTVYMLPVMYEQRFNVLDVVNGGNITHSADFNIDYYDYSSQTSPHDINMDGSYEGIFSATGYDSNTFTFTIPDTNHALLHGDNLYNNNLTSLWNFDNTLDDNKGSNDGAWGSGEMYEAGLWDTNGAGFDGSTDFVTLGSSSMDSNVFGEFTYSTWYYYDASGSNTLYSESTSGSLNGYFEFTTDDITGKTNGGSTVNVAFGLTTISNAWTHLVYTSDGAGNYTAYVNGVKYAETSDTLTGSTISGTNQEDIGVLNYFIAPTNYYGGVMDDVAFWDTELTEDDIRQLYYSYTIGDSNRTIYLTPFDVDINWINPIDGKTMNTIHAYIDFNISEGSGSIVDANFYLNGVLSDIDVSDFCTGFGTTNATCLFEDENIIPYAWNDLNIVVQSGTNNNYSSSISYYYNPAYPDANIDELYSLINDLNSLIQTNITNINDLNLQIIDLNSAIVDLNNSIIILDGNVISIASNIVDLNTALVDLNSFVNSFYNGLFDFNTSVQFIHPHEGLKTSSRVVNFRIWDLNVQDVNVLVNGVASTDFDRSNQCFAFTHFENCGYLETSTINDANNTILIQVRDSNLLNHNFEIIYHLSSFTETITADANVTCSVVVPSQSSYTSSNSVAIDYNFGGVDLASGSVFVNGIESSHFDLNAHCSNGLCSYTEGDFIVGDNEVYATLVDQNSDSCTTSTISFTYFQSVSSGGSNTSGGGGVPTTKEKIEQILLEQEQEEVNNNMFFALSILLVLIYLLGAIVFKVLKEDVNALMLFLVGLVLIALLLLVWYFVGGFPIFEEFISFINTEEKIGLDFRVLFVFSLIFTIAIPIVYAIVSVNQNEFDFVNMIMLFIGCFFILFGYLFILFGANLPELTFNLFLGLSLL